MNVAEGARRMRTAGRWMVLIALIGSALFVALTLGLAFSPAADHGLALLSYFPLCLPIALIGGVLWLAGWIVEGFAKKDQ